jgi:hypothetical protein
VRALLPPAAGPTQPAMTPAHSPSPLSGRSLRAPVLVKDLWQHRSQYVANTRWWPPFCLVVDWVAAAILVVLITVGLDFHH